MKTIAKMTRLIEHRFTSTGVWPRSLAGTLLAPCKLSRAEVMALILSSTAFAVRSSGCTRVGSLGPSYYHMGCALSCSGWIRRLRKVSSRSMTSTLALTTPTRASTRIPTSTFSSFSTLRDGGVPTLSLEYREGQSATQHSGCACSKTKYSANP